MIVTRCILTLSSLCLFSTLQPWRWACDPPPTCPTLFAIIPRIWTHYRTRPNTSAPNQGQAPFWFHTNVRMLIGENQYGWRLLLLAQNEGQFLHLSQTPSVTKPATENAYMTRFYVLCRAPAPSLYPTPCPSNLLSPRAKRKKMVEVYLLYFLIIALWCKMCRKCLPLPSLKTLESVHMHCELGKSLSCHFIYRHAYCVT